MSKTNPIDTTREQILKDGTVRSARVTISQKFYSNDTVSPIGSKTQEIVEIGIDDLMNIISEAISKAELEVQLNYILVQLGWLEPNKDNLTVAEILQHLNAQVKSIEEELSNNIKSGGI